ncbi:CLUMA_CG001312, isoform A [Clunio marinus]|uniref:CLUMA_CG001312, isoform A n=1 Tax=Clunio marinus TaxID=568069 RepID=A0A1J1HHK8_9DIPT|nr:CLUMA_CG001312, isoform A [Clunio marinus]
MSTERKLTEYYFNKCLFLGDNGLIFFFVQKILLKFKSNVRVLCLNKCILSDDQLCCLLRFVPEIKKLALINCRIKLSSTLIVDFTLKKLSSIDFSETRCFGSQVDRKSNNLIKSILQSLTVNSTIRKVTACGHVAKYFPLNQTRLTHLKLESVTPADIRIGDLFYQQYQLASLDLSNCFIMNDVLLSIKNNLNDLKTLKIKAEGIVSSGFSIIERMNLEEFGLVVGKEKWALNALTSFNFRKIRKVYISIQDLIITPRCCESLLKNMKNMESLHIVTNMLDIISIIFRTAGLRCSLLHCIIEFVNVDKLKHIPEVETNLNRANIIEEFKIVNTSKRLAKRLDFSFLKSFLNIRKLVINGFFINDDLLILAFEHHYKLEELTICGWKNMDQDFIFDVSENSMMEYLLHEYGRKLKRLEIDCIRFILSGNYIKSKFPVINRNDPSLIFRYR